MARITKPEALKRGDTIAVVAPGSAPKLKYLKLGIKRFKQSGFNVYIHPQCFFKKGYLAGDDKIRAKALMEVFANDNIKAVFCGRGGYGCIRLLRFLDFDLIKSNPKIFVGYSDVTVLLQAFSKDGFITFHGPMLSVDFAHRSYKFSLENLLNIIMTTEPVGELKNPKRLGPIKKYLHGKAEGIITGGNLSLLNKLVGTRFMPSFKNKIVFLEDVDEEPYRLDGYLSHLFLATDISQAAGFVIGQLVDCNPTHRTQPSLRLDEVFNEYFGNMRVPVITNFACGHGTQNHTIPIGVKGYIDADKKTFKITEKAVR
jgi:muramoyltetrapeptide carboxypeptidase